MSDKARAAIVGLLLALGGTLLLGSCLVESTNPNGGNTWSDLTALLCLIGGVVCLGISARVGRFVSGVGGGFVRGVARRRPKPTELDTSPSGFVSGSGGHGGGGGGGGRRKT